MLVLVWNPSNSNLREEFSSYINGYDGNKARVFSYNFFRLSCNAIYSLSLACRHKTHNKTHTHTQLRLLTHTHTVRVALALSLSLCLSMPYRALSQLCCAGLFMVFTFVLLCFALLRLLSPLRRCSLALFCHSLSAALWLPLCICSAC